VEPRGQRQGLHQGDARFRQHPRDPALDAARVADVAEKREALEGEKRAKLAAGVLGLDMYAMREPLARAGLKYID
jgi:hypothetical protein